MNIGYRKLSVIFTLIWILHLLAFYSGLYLAGYIFLEYTDWLVIYILGIITSGCLFFAIIFYFIFKTRNWKLGVFLIVAIPTNFLLAIVFMNYSPLVKQSYNNTFPRNNIKSKVVITADNLQETETYEEPKHGYQTGPTIKSNEKSYFISGRAREDLCEAIYKWQEDEGMEETLAYINYKIIYNYYTINTSKGYTIGEFTVTADSTITLPQWSSSDGASEGTKSDWRAFKNAVTSHEREHKDILIEYANELVKNFNDLGYYTTESSLKSAIDNKYNEIYSHMTSAQEEFDKLRGRSKSFSYLCR